LKTIAVISIFIGCVLCVYVGLRWALVFILDWIDRQFSDNLPDDEQISKQLDLDS